MINAFISKHSSLIIQKTTISRGLLFVFAKKEKKVQTGR